MPNQVTFPVRKTKNSKLILLIHGFSGESYTTFGMLPAFLAGDTQLTDYDICCFGYPTRLAPDITGIWSADPDLTTLAGFLSTVLTAGNYDQYSEITLIAHSMGGLIVQRALFAEKFLARVKHVFLFGTPSNGLRKAGLVQLFKRQARDMAYGGTFVTQLRADWSRKFSNGFPFTFRAIAGIRDEFVPVSSSVEVFDEQYRSYVKGNHIEMVKPQTLEDEAVALLRQTLSGTTVINPDKKDVPVTSNQYTETIQELKEQVNLSRPELTKLIFALEMSGKQNEAIALLEKRYMGDTDLTGILAGRFKRIWLTEPAEKEAEGKRSYDLYKQAFAQATHADDHEQAYYNGINVAFMELAFQHSRYDSRLVAVRVIEHCRLAKRDKWRLATEGEANLYMGEFKFAIDCYEAALRSDPDPREIDSMYKQAVWVARLLENIEVEKSLQKVFGSYIS